MGVAAHASVCNLDTVREHSSAGQPDSSMYADMTKEKRSLARATQNDISHACALVYSDSPSVLQDEQLNPFTEDCCPASALTC